MLYTTKNGVKLGIWVDTQRKENVKLQDRKHSAMTQPSIEKLEKYWLVWDARTAASKLAS